MNRPVVPGAAPDAASGNHRWGRIYAFVLAVLALLIAFFAWLTRAYS